MSVGQRKRIQLLKAIYSKSVSGANETSFTRYTYWAEVVRGSGSRSYQNSQTQLNSSYTFRIRYNSTIDPNSRYAIVYDGKQLTVTSVERENEKDFYWLIKASNGQG
jgi:SPP1 family predicted phage head-tail adaptor